MGAQELVDGAGDGVAEDGGVADEQLEVLLRVEEGRLDEDGGHGRAPQHREVGVDLDAAIREALVDAADGAPAVGEARDIRVAWRLAAQVVALHDLRLVAAALERDARILRDARVDRRLRHAVLAVDRAGVRTAAERMTWVDEDSHMLLLSREGVSIKKGWTLHKFHPIPTEYMIPRAP